MNISYKWLKEYVDFTLSPQETAEVLTSCGLEVGSVEEVQTIKGGLKGLFVGKVLTCEPHPNSDHLHITTVDLGREEPSQIVCGAANVAVGQKVIVADIGCVLYSDDKEFVIKKSKLRGVESHGMICAEDEIGVGTSHEGIIVLPDDAPIGMPAAQYYNVESDWLLEIDITANRADALSHYGVARDLYAWLVQNGYQTSLKRPSDEAFKVDNNSLPIDVTIEEPEACLRYACVSLTNCKVTESPAWLQDKLRLIGLRPINNIVDITNYIMMSYGQPMHCFDADMVTGHHIHLRTQPEGTKFITLDGEEHILGEHDLSVCNAEEPMCIAGIFGGKGSGAYDSTRNVVLESAYFNPTWVRKSARRHGLSTDASYRFERGIDPNGVIYALKQAAILCKELAGGEISMDIKDVYPQPIENAIVDLSYDYVDRLIGKKIGNDVIRSIVESMGMKVLEDKGDEGLLLEIPAYRVDVTRPCDVVEEILRIYGYNNVEIPTQLKSSLTVAGKEDEQQKLENLIGEMLVGGGFNEILNNSLTKVSYYQDNQSYFEAETVKLVNPLSGDLGVMRQSLLYGGLESIVRNVNRQQRNIRFFEFGNCYRYDAEKHQEDNLIAAYSETKHLGLWLAGKRVEGSWAHTDENSSVFELRAYVQNIFARVGIAAEQIVLTKNEKDIFSSGLTLTTKSGRLLAELGVVSSTLLSKFEIAIDVYFADIYWNNLMIEAGKKKILYKEISKYPAVSRDLALLVDKAVTFDAIEQVARQTEKKLLKKVELFDVYEGKNLPSGKKSYAVNFILQDEQATLKDKQIEHIMNKLIETLKTKIGAELR